MVNWWVQLFGMQGEVSPAQECARAVLIFAYGLLAIRIAGRRIFGRWSALDIIVSIVLGSNLSRAMTGSAPLFGTMLATTVLLALHWILARLGALDPAIARLVEGAPFRISLGGKIDRKTRLRHGVSEADLDEALRQAGIEQIGDAEKITLEPSGKITVIPKS